MQELISAGDIVKVLGPSGMHDKIIEAGIIFLLIYTPLAFGTVSEGSIALVELIIGLLLLVWLAKLFSQRHQCSQRRRRLDREHCHVHLIAMPALIPFLLFAGLVVLQFIPLPAPVLKIISPSSYRSYLEASQAIAEALPTRLSLSISAHATGRAFQLMLAYMALFWLTLNTIRSPRRIKRLVSVIIALGLFEALYGIFEHFSGRHQIFHYQKVSGFSVSGTFFNKNHFAGYMEMVIPLCFSLLFIRLNERSRIASKGLFRFLDDKYMKAILVAFLLMVMSGALILSASRGGVVAFAAGMLCLCVLVYQRKILRKQTFLIILLSLLAVAAALFGGHDLLLERLHTLGDLEAEVSFQLRRDIWKDSLAIVRDFPFLGSGLGSFSALYPRYQSFPSDLRVDYTENDYLQLLVETGLLGELLVLCGAGLFMFSTLNAWKKRRARWSIILTAGGMSALVSLLVHSLIDFNLHVPSNMTLFVVIAAMTSVAAHSRRRSLK